jgi:hypothetical protein
MAYNLDAFSSIKNQRAAIHPLSEGGLSLAFENGWVLAVYNKFEWITVRGNHPQPLKSGLLKEMSLADNRFVLLFDCEDVCLTVDVSDAGYVGPEAMVLSGPAGEIIVWN